MSHVMTLTQKRRVQATSGVDVLAGLWLIVAPFILGYGGSTAMVNDLVVGAAILLLASGQALSEVTESRWASWANVALGGWLIVTPFIFNFATGSNAMWNDIILGLVVAGMAVVSATSMSEEEAE